MDPNAEPMQRGEKEPIQTHFKGNNTVIENSNLSVDAIQTDKNKTVITDENSHQNSTQYSNGIVQDNKSENENKKPSRVYRIKRSVDLAFSPMLTSNNPLPEYATFWQKLKYGLMFPPHGTLAHYVQLGIIVLQIWAVLVALTKSEALPGGNFFSLIVLLVLCHFCSLLFVLIRLPPLVGK